MSDLHEAVSHVLAIDAQIAAMTAMLDARRSRPVADDDQDGKAVQKITMALIREKWRLIYEIAGGLQ